MLERRLLREPLVFLVRFALIAGVLYLLRGLLTSAYASVVAPVANVLLGSGVVYEQDGSTLSLVYTALGLRFTVHDILFQNLMVAVALFGATPASWRWKAKWGGIAVAVLWVSHVASLWLGAQVIVWDFVWGLPEETRAELLPRVLARVPAGRSGTLSHIFGLWHTWGRSSLALAIWVLASLPVLQGWIVAGEADGVQDTE